MKKSFLLIASLLLAGLHTLRADDFPGYFGNPVEVGDGWYYDETFGFLYPFDYPWVYNHSLGAVIAVAGEGHAEDIFYFWEQDMGWSFLNRATAPWLYFFNESGLGHSPESVVEGWYYSFGMTNNGQTPHYFYSHPLGRSVSTRLAIEIVNNTLDAKSADLRVPSENAYFTLYSTKTDNAFTPTGISLGTSYKLSDYLVAPHSRITRFYTTGFDSGRLFVSYDGRDADKKFIPNSGVMPSEQSSILPFETSVPRNEKIEITYTITGGIPGGTANLTAVDYYGLPMTLQTLDVHGNVLQTFTFFDNTATILSELEAIDPSITSKAILKDTHGNFLRALAPVQWANASPPGAISDNPYPSMASYLQSVAGQSVTIKGTFDGTTSNPPSDYNYTGTLQDTGSITLTGTTIPGDNLAITIQASDLVTGIYTANPPYMKGTQSGAIGDNDVYSAIVRDLLTGFNGGYIGGANTSDPSDQWWNLPPFQPQNGNDYYNTYAAVIQNSSQAYGFPFSDRMRPQLANFNSGVATLRITLLADDMLNAPILTATSATNDSVTLEWNAVSDATGYLLSYAPDGGDPIELEKVTTYTVTGLKQGTPYTFTIMATEGTRQSPPDSVTQSTTGTAPPVTGPGQWQAALAFPASMVQAGDTVTLNGKTASIQTSGQIEFENGIILTYVQVDGGDYSGTPTVDVSGGNGFNASATLTMNAGKVGAVVYDNPGFGYSEAPTVSFVGGDPVTQAQFTAQILTTTINQIPVAAPLNSQSTYAFSWNRENGDVVFASIFYVTTEGFQVPDDLNNGGLVQVSSDTTKTYLAGNLNQVSIDPSSPWVVNLTVQPNP